MSDDNSRIGDCAQTIRALAEMNGTKEEADIHKLVSDCRGNSLFSSFSFSDEQWEKVTRSVLEQLGHHLDMGVMITAKDHKSWYPARMRELQMEYTNRNTKYLHAERGMNKGMISALDEITNEILDGFGDPQEQIFKRRGLVMGDVQSGKTNTYVRICCKAADAGYKVIILLTGTLEVLRQQTQGRMDEGFVGFDSSALLTRGKESCIGVGKYPPKKSVVVYTSTAMDFRTNVATQVNVPLESTKDPILFVIKKNKSVLKNLNDWLRAINGDRQVEDSALLLIDDEADNASVNTAELENVTAINKEIRDMLGQFRKNTYVGFTATPYANIFIDPDADADLFPRDFIYSLSSPNNYVSPESIYSLDENTAENAFMIRNIEVDEKAENKGLPEIPYNHKKEHVIPSIPKSLQKAIDCFFLSCAIRDIRGDSKEHMSMLINVSRFTGVQESMKDLVIERLYDMRQSISTYSGLSVKDALVDQVIHSLWETFNQEYSGQGINWEDIQSKLDSATRSIVVRSVNSKNGAGTLTYKDTPDGLRLIAIGGNSLSRGLTLEGLCISYFYRRSQSYDTLMQMGRWFGYREGYKDLCRIWMTKDSREWYAGISQATEELKAQLEEMRSSNQTPEDFGLMVMDDVNGLMITSRNKMRTASNEYIVKSVNGRVVSTEYIFTDPQSVDANMNMIRKAIADIEDSGTKAWRNDVTENYVWRNVPKEHVISILKKFKLPTSNHMFDADALTKLIDEGRGEFESWDISVQHGEGKENMPKWGSITESQKKVQRKAILLSSGILRMSRIRAPRYFKEGIYDENGDYDERTIMALEEAYRVKIGAKKKSNVYSEQTYLIAEKRRPLLMIFPLEPVCDDPGMDEVIESIGGLTLIALSIGFPLVERDSADKYLIRFKANKIYRKWQETEDDYDEEMIIDE